MTTDHDSTRSDDDPAAEAHFDSLARSAGAELRKPAPSDGIQALEQRRRAQVRTRTPSPAERAQC